VWRCTSIATFLFTDMFRFITQYGIEFKQTLEQFLQQESLSNEKVYISFKRNNKRSTLRCFAYCNYPIDVNMLVIAYSYTLKYASYICTQTRYFTSVNHLVHLSLPITPRTSHIPHIPFLNHKHIIIFPLAKICGTIQDLLTSVNSICYIVSAN